MIILHAGIVEGAFFLWGETPEELDPRAIKGPRGKNRSPKDPSFPKPLRYNAGIEKLTSVFKEIAFDLKIRNNWIEALALWLCAVGDHPVPSSPLIAQPPASIKAADLMPWKVTALRLPIDKAVSFLCRCSGRRTLGMGVIVGEDLSFFTQVMRFAGAVVAKGQFLPDVAELDGAYFAKWKPVSSGEDTARLAKLAKAMPEAARALTREVSKLPDTPSLSLLSGFINGAVDYLVRSSLAEGFRVVPTATPRQGKKPVSHDSIHDQWLHALHSPSGLMEGDGGELLKLTSRVKEWVRPISVSTEAPFRLCFRIEEPVEEPDTGGMLSQEQPLWNVQYLLQANEDPSLLIPAEEAWKDRNILPPVYDNFNVREYLLLSLGQASGLCPHIEASLKTSKPAGYTLDATGACEFLAQKAWILEQSGFGVMLPAWWTRKGTKLRLSARASVRTPQMQSASGFSLDQVIQFDWEVALGRETLSFEELQRLARLKLPLVKVRGQWVQINSEEIEAILRFWKKKTSEQATVRDIVRMALGAERTPGDTPLEGIKATGWIAALLAELEGRTPFKELPAPKEFQGTLRPYQVRGYSWLSFLRRWGLGACLADDMGLGKTIQTLALIQKDWQSGNHHPVLLVCPTSVISNWQKEAGRFTPDLPVLVHHGIERRKGEAFKKASERYAMVVSSYALLARDIETFKEMDWTGVVLDEAQNIKNPETKQAKAARGIKAGYRIALTGTPVENSVGDLWSVMEFLNSGFLGSQTEFKNRFFIPIQANKDPEATERLKRLTTPFILRRLKTDRTIIADLPEKMEMKVFCTLTKEQASLYEAVVKESMDALDEAEGIKRKGLVLATLSKLKQVCNHPAQFLGDNSPIPGRSGKLARLTEMLEEMMEVGDRALIFSQFAELGKILQRYFQETFGREVLFLHGGVPKKERDRMVDRFQADGNGPSIFILSLRAGGTGLNLTRANHVTHFDRWWNPAVENQATDRTFRIGQTKNVQVHKFICAGTLEEKIDEMIERKKDIAEKVIGTGEGWLTELSTNELKNLFTLRREAIGE